MMVETENITRTGRAADGSGDSYTIPVSALLERTERGLYCAAGNFYVDPWTSVPRAVITHAHSDHARSGSGRHLAAKAGEALLRARIGTDAAIEAVEYGAGVVWNGVRVSLHPAGHILGSAQVRIERGGEVWVVSGDYKVAPDPTCTAFEPIRCHTFVTESTFGLPIFRWPEETVAAAGIRSWWRANQEAGKVSVLFAYAVGKAQRVLAGLAEEGAASGPIYTHGAVESVNAIYRAAGIRLAETRYAGAQTDGHWGGSLIVAPPSASGSPWLRRFGEISTAFASGWMRIRGTRRRRSLDRGFVISDHADWPGLLGAIETTGAERVWVTHGYRAPLVRWLQEHGHEALAIETQFEGEQDESGAEASEEAQA